MAFSRTNKMRTKKKEASDQLKEIPNRLTSVQTQITEIFKAFDTIGQELVHLAMYDIDPAMLESLDTNFKEYNKNKSEVVKTVEDLVRISATIKESENLLNTQGAGSSGMTDTVIDDLQSVLTNINSTLGSDVAEKLDQLKELQEGIELINKPVEAINESINAFQKTVDVTFEIFTKSSLESMKNSTEMNDLLEQMEDRFFNFQAQMGQQINSIEGIVRGLVNESLGNMEHRINKTLETKLKDMQLAVTSEIEKIFSAKVGEIESQVKVDQAQLMDQIQAQSVTLSRDMQEMKNFKDYMYSWPSSKDEITQKIEEFRDILLVKRGTDAPYRVSATNLFRESLNLLSREEKIIDRNKVREVIDVFEKLEQIIRKSESN